jgi:hypothetical protein
VDRCLRSPREQLVTKSGISFIFILQLRALAPWVLLSALHLHAGHALAQETCERIGIEFGFFNGVQTTLPQAQEVARDVLPSQYGRITPDGQPISYTLYYNDTQAGIADFIETFEQRLQEQDGLLAGRFELFFSAMNGGGSWWSVPLKIWSA